MQFASISAISVGVQPSLAAAELEWMSDAGLNGGCGVSTSA
jgi:hypothetical protein